MFKRQFDAMLIGLNNTVNLCPTSRTYAPPQGLSTRLIVQCLGSLPWNMPQIQSEGGWLPPPTLML